MILHVFDAFEVVASEPFCADRPVVALDVCVLLGLSRLDVKQPDPRLLGPCLESATDIFWAVIHANGQRFTSSGANLFERADNALGGQ